LTSGRINLPCSLVDAYLAGIYIRHLKACGYEVKSVFSIEDVRKRLQRLTPEALILDVSSEEENGFAFLHTFRIEHPSSGISIIVIIREGNHVQIQTALKQGIDAFFIKGTFTPHELTQGIMHALEERKES